MKVLSAVVYYLQVSRATQYRLLVSLFLKNDAASAIGFVCLSQVDATSISTQTDFRRYE